jgi:NADH dehydrogenase
MNITIVGGGFGGVKAALELAEDASNQVTIITDKPDFQYYPALYSAATGHSHLESWVPLGTIFAGKHNIRVYIDSILSIDPKTKSLKAASGKTYNFEKCILALGTVTTYFGIKGLETYAYGIKSAAEIKRLKQHIYVDIAENHKTDKHYIIVGAGPTGVELAAALGSYLTRMCEHYGVKKPKLQIDVIEAAPRILPRMSEKTSKRVQKRLEKIGVNVQTGKTVEAASDDDLTVSGNSIDSRTVIWTSGVANHPFYKNNEAHFEFSKNGRIVVDEYMRAAKDIYVIGDNAATPFTGLAQTALHDAMFVSGNLKRQAKHQKPRKYKAVMPPVVVPVGENWAVFEWHRLRLYGWVASLLRRAADFIGYSDMLPLGQALGVWHATLVMEDDYFTPTSPGK